VLEALLLYWHIILPFFIVFFSYRSRIMDVYPKCRTPVRKNIINKLYFQLIYTTTAICCLFIVSIFTVQPTLMNELYIASTFLFGFLVVVQVYIMNALYSDKIKYKTPKFVIKSLRKIVLINYILILTYPFLMKL
jgi:hypothetical protein